MMWVMSVSKGLLGGLVRSDGEGVREAGANDEQAGAQMLG
jgi:hypothetical protein